MLKPDCVFEIELHKPFRNFEIQTDPPIQTRRPDLVLSYKKKNLSFCGFCGERRVQSEIKGKRKSRQISLPCQLWNVKLTVIPVIAEALGTVR